MKQKPKKMHNMEGRTQRKKVKYVPKNYIGQEEHNVDRKKETTKKKKKKTKNRN